MKLTEKLMFFVGFWVLLGFSSLAFASDVPSELSTILNIVGPFIMPYVEKYPVLGKVMEIMLVSRMVIKPLMVAIQTIYKDAQFDFLKVLAEFSDSKIYKIIAFILDWVASIKLPKK